MANNYNTSSNFTTEHYPWSNTSIGIVSGDSIPTSDKSMPLSKQDHELPTYDTFTAPSAPDIGDLPPNYFDISIVPNGAILYNNQVTPYTEVSKAEIERNKKGVRSFDPLIDQNPDQLWLYFMTYLNEKPQLKVNINGSYTEYYTTTETYTDSDGNTQTRDVQQSRTVTEFHFSVDISPYICNQWWRVAVVPLTKAVNPGEMVTFRDALEQYTLSRKKIKEIVLQKQLLGWNLVELQRQLITLVLSTGYHNDICITYSTFNQEIVARSSSKLSRFANSSIVRVLCCISCLCIIFGPIYYCLREIGSTRDKIIADYMLMKSADTFLQFNAQMIANAVKQRSYESYVAHFA
ncbi:unnamed protein product [Rotaria sordida]|uniref:Uncharacterized protein n=1 Tax=Rotaria sordida TaxID=392033 RepID=A0A819QE84_9BILA|nr:unnamed protein product [Rotaria sordida]CAF4029322.1 unnamed protein product [Rotaria sordida]